MEPNFLIQTLASVVAASAPVVLAAIGENSHNYHPVVIEEQG
jgi:hypothetical protein